MQASAGYHFDAAALADPETLVFPEHFQTGFAICARQTEGNRSFPGLQRWDNLDASPLIRSGVHDGSDLQMGCDLLRWYPEMIAQLAAAGSTVFRFSVDWSRIEPHPGQFNSEALNFYSGIARACREVGMLPMVTLHHFSEPAWFSERGGARSADAPGVFARFTRRVAEAMPDVTHWITINEPVTLVYIGCILGEFPPHERSLGPAADMLGGLLEMHAAAANVLHEVGRSRGTPAIVSLSIPYMPMEPNDPQSVTDRLVTVAPNLFEYDLVISALATGRVPWPVSRRFPPGAGKVIPGLKGSCDFAAIQYYTTVKVQTDLHAPLGAGWKIPAPGEPRSSYGWAMRPDGLLQGLRLMHHRLGLPIWVTEYGWSDESNHPDSVRRDFYRRHLAAIHTAIREGIDVRGALAWTPIDNDEWMQGRLRRFGVYDVDVYRGRHVLVPRESAKFLEAFARARALPARELRGPWPDHDCVIGDRYLPGWLYRRLHGLPAVPSAAGVPRTVSHPSPEGESVCTIVGVDDPLVVLPHWMADGPGRLRARWLPREGRANPNPHGVNLVGHRGEVATLSRGTSSHEAVLRAGHDRDDVLDFLLAEVADACQRHGSGIHIEVFGNGRPGSHGSSVSIRASIVTGRPGVMSVSGSERGVDLVVERFNAQAARAGDGTWGAWAPRTAGDPRQVLTLPVSERVLLLRRLPGRPGVCSVQHVWGDIGDPGPYSVPRPRSSWLRRIQTVVRIVDTAARVLYVVATPWRWGSRLRTRHGQLPRPRPPAGSTTTPRGPVPPAAPTPPDLAE